MKRLLSFISCFLVLTVLVDPVLAADPAAAPKEQVADKSPSSTIATAVSTVTGIAISPLMGTSAYGAYQYFTATTPEQKAALPWYARVSFWLPALLVVGVCAFKDSFAAMVPPGMKKPLDVLETVENKASGLVAAGAVIPFTMDSLSKLLVSNTDVHASLSTGLATLSLGSIDVSWLLNVLTIPFGVAMFVLVWMASHAINVLILLSPWGAIDTALKGARTGLLGLLTLSATINPWVGAGLSLVVILIAYLCAGWAFRLTIFGSLFCWDFFTLRKKRFVPAKDSNWLFSGALLTKLKVPVRTYGQLSLAPEAGHWVFTYRPWLVGPVTTVKVEPENSQIGKGLFFSTLRDKEGTLFILPPRYRDHEEELVAIYAIPDGVRPAGLLKAWGAVRELFSGTAARSQVA